MHWQSLCQAQAIHNAYALGIVAQETHNLACIMASGCGHQHNIAFATNGTMLDFGIVGCEKAVAILQPWPNSLGYMQQVLWCLPGLHQATALVKRVPLFHHG